MIRNDERIASVPLLCLGKKIFLLSQVPAQRSTTGTTSTTDLQGIQHIARQRRQMHTINCVIGVEWRVQWRILRCIVVVFSTYSER